MTASAMRHMWCKVFSEDRQGHSRDHVEEECEREPNKRKDGTFHDDVYDAPQHTNKHSTSWLFDLVSPWRLDHPSGSRQDTHCTLGPLRRKAVGGSTSRARARDTVTDTSVEHGWRPHKPGGGVKARGTEVIFQNLLHRSMISLHFWFLTILLDFIDFCPFFLLIFVFF